MVGSISDFWRTRSPLHHPPPPPVHHPPPPPHLSPRHPQTHPHLQLQCHTAATLMILNGRPLPGIHRPAARWLPSPAIHAYAEAPTVVVETPAYVFPAHRASQCMLGPNRTLTSCPTTSYWVGRDAMHQRATQVQRMLKARVSVQILLGGFRWRGWVC